MTLTSRSHAPTLRSRDWATGRAHSAAPPARPSAGGAGSATGAEAAGDASSEEVVGMSSFAMSFSLAAAYPRVPHFLPRSVASAQ